MPHPHRVARLLALAATIGTVLAIAGGPVASAGATVPEAGGDTPEVVATLKIESANVAVKKKAADTFKAAKDGQKLRAGDTIQTDGTGKAEIDYSDDSYTRLDVDTTFTIEKLSDEQGNRQVEGSLDSGKAWHRTAALTESQTFEQTGAGATAAVVGTAFGMGCDTPDHCTVYPIVDSVEWTGNNAVQLLAPLETCDSTSAIVCADTSLLTPDQLPQWIIDNILKDVLAGYPYPFTIVVTDDGNAFFVPSEGSPPPTPPTPPPGAPPAPVIDANPVNVTSYGSDPTPGTTPGPNTRVVSQDERNDVTFMLQVTNPSGGSYWIVFTDLPAATFGQLLVASTPVDLVTHYAPNTTFTYNPVEIEPVCSTPTFAGCFTNGVPNEGPNAGVTGPYPSPVTASTGPAAGSVQWSDSFTFKAQNDQGGETPEQQVELVAVDDICTTRTEASRPDAETAMGCGLII